MHYNLNRYYDPAIGRYITQAPIKLAGSLNFYGYVDGDPINLIDPLGLFKQTTGGRDNLSSNKGEPLLPDEAWSKNAPHQVTPGIKEIEHYKYNKKTKQLERSIVEYDKFGRQIKRIDYTDHGYGKPSSPDFHSNPHMHIYEYGSGFSPKGREIRINLMVKK